MCVQNVRLFSILITLPSNPFTHTRMFPNIQALAEFKEIVSVITAPYQPIDPIHVISAQKTLLCYWPCSLALG